MILGTNATITQHRFPIDRHRSTALNDSIVIDRNEVNTKSYQPRVPNLIPINWHVAMNATTSILQQFAFRVHMYMYVALPKVFSRLISEP